MARDRLAAIRAAQDPGFHSFPQQAALPTRADAGPPQLPLGNFGGSPGYGGSDFEYSDAWVAPYASRSRPSLDSPNDSGPPSSVPATRSSSNTSSSSGIRRSTSGSRSAPRASVPPPLPGVAQSIDSRQSSLVPTELGSPETTEPPRDFNPFYNSQSKPGPPALIRQRSASSHGARLSEDKGRALSPAEAEPIAPSLKPDFNPYAPAVQTPGSGRAAPPYDGSEAGEEDHEYPYSEKASTVDLEEKRHLATLGSAQDIVGTRGVLPTAESEPRDVRPKIKAGDVPYEGMNEFFEEISDLQQAVRQCGEEIIEIQFLHQRLLSLPSADDPQAIAASQRLVSLSTSTRSFFSAIRNRILELEQGNANLRALIPAGQSICNLTFADVDVRQAQVNALKEKFKISIQTFAEVERESRAKNRTRMERQVKTVNPTLSPVEVEEVVRKAEAGGGDALFSQAVLKSQLRSNAARGALREVESRAAALAQIEETLAELAQLFADMAMLVEAQDVQVVDIEKRAVEVEKDMEQGVKHVEQAVVSARSARKYRWYFFWISFLIFVIVLFVVIFEVVVPAVKSKGTTTTVTSVSTKQAPTVTAVQTVQVVSTLILSVVPNTAAVARSLPTAPPAMM